ncbi:hypothetical protein IWW43_004038 [Coemansia sp. RSA 1935]|nr:hypothetical protein IWW43_004038 [Coemansia sp. RSA 1935]
MPGFTSADELLNEFATELRQHTYGISSFTQPKVTLSPLRAESVVTLLDGAAVRVELSGRGYAALAINQANVVPGNQAAVVPSEAFELLTGLLMAVSPGFQRAMHSHLYSKLLALSDSEPAPEPSGSDPVI